MKKGFTLLELIVVVIILGVLASVSLPLYFNAVERGRLAEGLNYLGAVRSAQLRYVAQKSVYTNLVTDLDVDMMQKFFIFVNTAAVGPTTLGTVVIASCRRTGTSNPFFGQYTLAVTEYGTITCTNATVAGVCAKLGY